VRATLLALYELQSLDSGVLEIEKGGIAIPKKILEAEAGLDGLRAEVGKLNAEADDIRRQISDMEAVSSEESSKHRKWKSRLNEIKSPREYQALSRELEMGERQVRENDEKGVTMLAQIDELQKRIDAKNDDLRQAENAVSAKVRELREAMAKLTADAEKARTGRDVAVAKVPERIFKKYEQLRAHKAGIAVALVSDGTCRVCNVRLRPQHYVTLLRCESLEQCSTCQRILVPEVLIKGDDKPAQ
jgi:predicted  nucleic acid-binding Zn-ribbon protein